MRVEILNEYAKSNFPSTPLLDYAYEVEKITTSKVSVYVSHCQSTRLTDVTGVSLCHDVHILIVDTESQSSQSVIIQF